MKWDVIDKVKMLICETELCGFIIANIFIVEEYCQLSIFYAKSNKKPDIKFLGSIESAKKEAEKIYKELCNDKQS